MADKEYIERGAVLALKQPIGAFGMDICSAEVKEIPVADVAPVVHAEWEFHNDGRYGQRRCYCSACGKHSGIGGIRENQMKPFCPNCGAKMDGGKNDDRQ